MARFSAVITTIPDRAYCSVETIGDAGYQRIVTGTIDKLEASELENPLVYFRGKYRALDDRG